MGKASFTGSSAEPGMCRRSVMEGRWDRDQENPNKDRLALLLQWKEGDCSGTK